MPRSSAAALMIGLNAEPGCRPSPGAGCSCSPRNSRPPTRARTSPDTGSSATRLACRSRAALRAFVICVTRRVTVSSATHWISGVVAGVDAQPPFQHRPIAEACHELPAHFLLGISAARHARNRRVSRGRRPQRHLPSGSAILLLDKPARIAHQAQHRLPRASARSGAALGAIRRRAHEPGKQGAFVRLQIRRRLAEIAARCRLDPCTPSPKYTAFR